MRRRPDPVRQRWSDPGADQNSALKASATNRFQRRVVVRFGTVPQIGIHRRFSLPMHSYMVTSIHVDTAYRAIRFDAFNEWWWETCARP
jgi:hypothetical protein